MARRANEARLPVRAVIKRTGLSADVLRAWERRYGAVKPARTAGGQRLYSESDVERLTLLRRAATAGHSIAEVATLDLSALEALIDEPTGDRSAPPAQAVARAIADALEAAERLDRAATEQIVRRFALGFGTAAMVDHVVGPFLREVGERWHAGTLSPAHEHLASRAIASVLGWALDSFNAVPRAPRLIVTTPAGEQHELGALLAAAAAAEEGWRVV
jgi:DNA-binding transcriptional MerR regulator